jgi:hypothetical protein
MSSPSDPLEPYPYRLSWEEIQEASQVEPEASFDPLLVSVDYDFFVPLPEMGDFPDEEAEMLVAGCRWALEEWFSAQRSLNVFEESYSRIVALGHSPEELYPVDPSITFQWFAAQLHRLFDFQEVLIADSHLWGAYATSRLSNQCQGKPIEIINIDAHHDCGYFNYRGDTHQRSQSRALKNPSCDDWIQSSLAHDKAHSAQIIYPDWRGSFEWERIGNTLPPALLPRVTPKNWSGYLAENQEVATPRKATLLLVRSATYVPPWGGHDQNFLDLGRELTEDSICLDCLKPNGLVIGNQNGCKPRSWKARS